MQRRSLFKVLLIDDDPVSNLISETICRKLWLSEAFEISVNGSDAIDHIKDLDTDQLPDLILLDLYMPLMDGYEFIKEFNSIFKDSSSVPKLYVLTSVFHEKELQRLKKLGIEVLLTKPLSVEQLRNQLYKDFDYLKLNDDLKDPNKDQ